MSLLNMLRGLLNMLRGYFRGIVCPLCGGKKKPYKVRGEVDYFTLTKELVARPNWMRVHGLTGSIPNPPDQPGMADMLREIAHPPVVSRDDASSLGEVEHTRCQTCDTLLPPEFLADVGVARDFAITVAGLVGHGKTSWLLAILSASPRADFEIVRPNKRLMTKRYPYAEPYTVDVLEKGFRSPMYYQLFGTTLIFDKELTFIRTLDIKGEMFEGHQKKRTVDAIVRHLESGEGEGWLLVIDQFAGYAEQKQRIATRSLKSVGRAYEEIRITMEMNGETDRVKEAVVWTFLDEARWNEQGATWLREQVPDAAESLIAIAATAGQPVHTLAPYTGFAEDPAALDSWIAALDRGTAFDGPTVDALVALLFRLQLLYTLRAGQAPVTKFTYFESTGRRVVKRLQGIAKRLYAADMRAPMHELVKETEGKRWTVFPCGRIDGMSVWSDQILLHALAESMK